MRAPVKPIWHHTHALVGNSHCSVPITLAQEVVLQHFERMVARASVVTKDLETLFFRNVMVNASISDASLRNVIFLEDSVPLLARQAFYTSGLST